MTDETTTLTNDEINVEVLPRSGGAVVGRATDTVVRGQAGGDTDGTDADGTDGDGTHGSDGDSGGDADGTDGDSGDADGTDGDTTDATDGDSSQR
jgi:hypothetical protein